LIYLEQFFRKKARFSDAGGKKLSNYRTPLNGWERVWTIVAIGLPLLIGFIVPVAQLIYWASIVYQDVLTSEFWVLLLNTFKMALIASVVCVSVAVVLHFSYRWSKNKWIQVFARMSTLGYAIPGAVIGVGVLLPIAVINQQFDVLLTGTLATLVFAYLVRFQAVSYNAVGAGFDKQSPYLSEAARSLGTNATEGFRKVIFPLIRPAVLSALVLVFVDVTKELPLTMLFQTFNFETLSVRAFVLMETDGAVYDSSVPSLIIVLIGLVPAILLNQLSKR
jgi:iron(III) transport system permease protein